MPFQLFTNDLGVDLGTSNVLIYVHNRGIVVREPSVVAVDKNTGRILQVGAAARNMLGRTPGNVVAMHPLQDGVISDHEMTVRMLQRLFRTATRTSLFTPKPRVVICVPSGVTEVQERTVINAAIEAGAHRLSSMYISICVKAASRVEQQYMIFTSGRFLWRTRRLSVTISLPVSLAVISSGVFQTSLATFCQS